MNRIKLRRIELRNFKGIKGLSVEFGENVTSIQGDNGVGKTTIYDAYLWCIFGATSGSNQIVQMLDSENKVIHKVETIVALLVEANGVESVIERRLVEKWKAAGTPEERFEGTTTQRYFNEVPMSVADFNARLASICSLNEWALLSNIRNFMGMKMEDRRKVLLSSCGEVDEEKLMREFPAVKKAKEEGKTLEELTRQMKSIRKRADSDLLSIPTKISAQDALKVELDFELLRADLSNTERVIEDIDKQLQASPEELSEVKEYRDKVDALQKEINKVTSALYDKHEVKVKEMLSNLRELKKQRDDLADWSITAERKYNENVDTSKKALKEFEEAKKGWQEANEMVFEYKESSKVCPICGRPLTEEMKAKEKSNAIAEFNTHKSQLCSDFIYKAQKAKNKVDELAEPIREYEERRENVLAQIQSLDTAIREKETEYKNETLVNVTNCEEIESLENKMKELVANKPIPRDNTELLANKKAMVDKCNSLRRQLFQEETNKKIDEQKVLLEEEAKQLAQTIAECDDVLYQVKCYKRQRVEAVESSVNSHFRFAKWKFYEKNISNDDDKEICTCTVDGVDYDNLNNAMKINVGIDIIDGLSECMGIKVPLFVDNAESVNKPLEIDTQMVLLKVSKDKELKVILPI